MGGCLIMYRMYCIVLRTYVCLKGIGESGMRIDFSIETVCFHCEGDRASVHIVYLLIYECILDQFLQT